MDRLIRETGEKFESERNSLSKVSSFFPVPKTNVDYWNYGRPGRDPGETAYLLAKGRVVWGFLVQANQDLFVKGDEDLPGAVIYSLDPYFEDRLGELEEISQHLFAFRDDPPRDPPLRDIALRLDNEFLSIANRQLPLSLSEGKKVFISEILFIRKHLPGHLLAKNYFPVLAEPQRARSCMFLPARFWSENLLRHWLP